jgi:hypothetical protein
VKSSSLITHPDGGGRHSFGLVPAIRSCALPAGEIYLKFGEHRGPQSGFGLIHIWQSHYKDLMNRGFLEQMQVVDYVAAIAVPGAPIYCEYAHMRKPRLAVLKSLHGILIIEYRPLPSSNLSYSVITAYPRKQAHGVLVGKIEKAP